MKLFKSKKNCKNCIFLVKGQPNGHHATILSNYERKAAERNQFDFWLTPGFILFCSRSHWREQIKIQDSVRFETICEINRANCPDYLKYDPNISHNQVVARVERQNKRSWIIEKHFWKLSFGVLGVIILSLIGAYASELVELFKSLLFPIFKN